VRLTVAGLARRIKRDLLIDTRQERLSSYGKLELVRRYFQVVGLHRRNRRALRTYNVHGDYGCVTAGAIGGRAASGRRAAAGASAIIWPTICCWCGCAGCEPCPQRVYESARLYVNLFQPSFKLTSKQREGTLVHKHYHPPFTPY